MIKIRKIKLSGFRGIPNDTELDLTQGGKEPRSFVLYGPNSSGKTSFVDGIEWFLSEDSKIQWLQREEAKEKSYPHQAAKESSVEIDFYDSEKVIKTLSKQYDHKAKTKPTESDEGGFKKVYEMFVIPPHLRYMEIIDFVYQKTAYEKYQQLANWMGFENELTFQEKLSVDIPRDLREYENRLILTTTTYEDQIKRLISKDVVLEATVLEFSNEILKRHKIVECKSFSELPAKITEISKLKSASSAGEATAKLTRTENVITIFIPKKDLPDELARLEKDIENFKKEQKQIQQIDVIELYTKALDLLTKQTEEITKCPVCGTGWEREKLNEHIREELNLLKKVKEDKEKIEREASSLKIKIDSETTIIKELIDRYKEAEGILSGLSYGNASNYFDNLSSIAKGLFRPLDETVRNSLSKENIEQVVNEKNVIAEQIKIHKLKIQQSEAESKLIEDVEKLNHVKNNWQTFKEAKNEQEFASQEIQSFYKLKDEVVKTIQENVKSRFDSISGSIGKYFSILRKDKDIKDIEIQLNEQKGKAAGRSAEIQLSYYDISVKPAYKVLSESLLNSLGLAVYFTCVKHFNTECKFIVLDDIMNSLDIEKRDTLLTLIQDEFPDYQIILFTHDELWFQKIAKRFPSWIRKKIKSWDYANGPRIDNVITTKEEIEEYLTDSTKTKIAGQTLTGYIEDTLNELCEGLWAEVRHRYTRIAPPTLEELFEALYKRLKSRLKTHPLVEQVLEAKKFAPILRNFVSHSRTTSISPEEVREVLDKWFPLEAEFWCGECNQFVEYQDNKDVIECHCGKKKLEAPKK